MKIISYNVNGIRAAMSKNLTGWLKETNPDVLCVQETKAQPEQIETAELNEMGYFCFVHSAHRKGYSGVAIFTRIPPNNIVAGMDLHKYDSEGRVLRADFDDLTVVTVYIPNGSSTGERHQFKMDFLADFQHYISTLRETRPNIIVCGDFNIAHKPVDIYDPESHEGTSGYLPEERAWLNEFESSGMADSFREFDKNGGNYTWWDMRTFARGKNLGWRIDYFWVSQPLKNRLESAGILSDAFHSDHCPVMLQVTNISTSV